MDDVDTTLRSARRSQALLASLLAVCIGVIGIAIWSGASDDTSPADSTAPKPPAAVTIDGWTPYWVLDRILKRPDSGDSRLRNLREVSPFWFSVNGFDSIEPDTLAPNDLAQTYIDRLRNSDVAIVPSLLDRMDAGQMATVLSDPIVRAAHVDAIRRFADCLLYTSPSPRDIS